MLLIHAIEIKIRIFHLMHAKYKQQNLKERNISSGKGWKTKLTFFLPDIVTVCFNMPNIYDVIHVI